MYIRIIEKPTKKSESLGSYSEDIQIDVNDLREVDKKIYDVWQRRERVNKDTATYCIYDDKDKPLFRGDLTAREGLLMSVGIFPICDSCLGDLTTHGQFARRYGTTETEESRRKIHYCCMNEKCEQYGIDHEMKAILPV